jgi:hypothetical protein
MRQAKLVHSIALSLQPTYGNLQRRWSRNRSSTFEKLHHRLCGSGHSSLSTRSMLLRG